MYLTIILGFGTLVAQAHPEPASLSNTVSFSSTVFSFDPVSTPSGTVSFSSTLFSFEPNPTPTSRLSSISTLFSFDPTSFQPSTTSSTPSASTGLSGVTGVSSNVSAFAHLWGWVGCDASQKRAILQGLEDAHSILSAEGVFYLSLGKHFNDYAAVEFLGDPRRAFASRQAITDQFQRAYDYQQHWYHWWDTQVFCLGDYQGYCLNEPGYVAVENNFDKYGLALGFCQRYFSLGVLGDIYKQTSKNNAFKWDLSHYENRGRAWITTMMRITSIGRYPGQMTPVKSKFPGERFQRFVVSCSETKFLSKNSQPYFDPDGAVKTLANPDNWSWFALAQYVTHRLGNYPSQPRTPDDLNFPAYGATVNASNTDGHDLMGRDMSKLYIPW